MGNSDAIPSGGEQQKLLSEEDVNDLLLRLRKNADSLALRRIIPNPEYSERRHEYVAFDEGWHSGTKTETQRSCITSERYRVVSGLSEVPKSQIDIVPIEQTPMPYWLSGLVSVGCPNHEDVWVSVNEMLLSKTRTCAECGSELIANV